MTDNKENVVFLAFDNPKAEPAEFSLSACSECRNKTFTVRHDVGEYPMMYCAACSQAIGRIGWAQP